MAIIQSIGSGGQKTIASITLQFLEHSYTWHDDTKKHSREKYKVISSQVLFAPIGTAFTLSNVSAYKPSGYDQVKRVALATIYSSDNTYHHRNVWTKEAGGNLTFTVLDDAILTFYCE